MKIALVINSFPKISEAFIVRQAEKLDAEIITLNYNKVDAEKYNIDKSKVHVLNSNFNILDKAKHKLLRVPCRVWSSNEKHEFKKLLLELKIDIVLSCFGPNGINVMEECSALGIPYVVQFLGYDASTLMKNKWYRQKIVEVINNSKSSVVLYNGMQDIFIKNGAGREKFVVLNIGVPTENFDFIKPDYKEKRPTEFLAVGRLVEKKSPINLLKSFLKCVEQTPDVCLNLIGDGELKKDVEEFISTHPVLVKKVTLHGFLGQNELKEFYLKAHVFVQHSITAVDGNKEGWPVGIAEACACGLPVISTWHAGIPDQVLDQVTGYLVQENDYEAMGNYMSILSLDWTLAEQMGKQGKEHIHKHGDLNQQVEALKHLLKNSLN